MSALILVVGDPHAHPRYDNDRFEVIGRFAKQRLVDRIHCVGDWTDFPSLNRHKSMMEAREGDVAADIAAGNDALLRLDEGLDGFQVSKTITLGNHDEYPEEYVARVDPTMRGKLAWSDVRFKAHGWRVTRFRESSTLNGLRGSHFFPSGVSGKNIGGTHAAHAINSKHSTSSVSGHSHLFDHKIKTFDDGRTIHAWVVGCTAHPAYAEPWCRNTVHLWQRGLLLVRMGRWACEGFEWVPWTQVEREAGR